MEKTRNINGPFAAPDLLGLLKSAVVYMEGCPLDYGGEEGLMLLEKSRAAIAKAEGQK